MRAPRRRRPRPRTVDASISAEALLAISERASYVGSQEHKDTPSFAGMPRPRVDASLCSRALADEQALLDAWLKTAIREGRVGPPWEGEFPRYVWHATHAAFYEARLVNRGLGQYKGYPVDESEFPPSLRSNE